MKTLLFSITKKDFTMQTFRCPGAGGGGKDTSSSGVRLIHNDSGAVGECRETRSITQNRKRAFEKLVATKKFQQWHRIECARRMGKGTPETEEQIRSRVDQMVDAAIRSGDILVEEFSSEKIS